MQQSTTVMGVKENGVSFEKELELEYKQAVAEGFKGTQEEYLAVRNYI